MKADYPSPESIRSAAAQLACDEAAIRAIAEVEAGQWGAFLHRQEGEPPVILYERHLFDRMTDGRFRGSRAPGMERNARPELDTSLLSWPQAGGYGRIADQHRKLQAAVELDREAALMACSWGLFQILGSNHERSGFPELQDFVDAMWRSADDHLRALVAFVLYDARLVGALRSHDWLSFALRYNGPREAASNYHGRIAAAWQRLSAGAAPRT